MRYVRAAGSFVIVFFCVFVLTGWFILPLVPPVPDRPVSVVERRYWIDNWPGYLLGLLLGGLTAWQTLRHRQRDSTKRNESAAHGP